MGRRRRKQKEPILYADYHRYRQMNFRVGGEIWRVITKPGLPFWDRVDRDTELLVEAMDVGLGETVLDLGCGYGLVGLVAARQAIEGRVYLVDDYFPAVEAARQTLALNGVQNAEARLSAGFSAVGDVSFDVVFMRLPKGRGVVERLVAEAKAALRLEGRLYLAGATGGGIKTAFAYLQRVFGNGEVLCYGGGHRVVMAMKLPGQGEDVPLPEPYSEFTASVRGQEWRAVSRPGIFAHGKLDEGTRLLIEMMDIRPKDTVLDLGSGCGIVGLVAASLAPQGRVYLVDAYLSAVEASQRTLALNEVQNAEVRLSDCASAVRDIDFDVVVTNPPFHQGFGVERVVAHQFIVDATQVLRPRGRLYLVANRFIPYERVLQKLFQELEIVYEDNRYRVWKAMKPRRGARAELATRER